MNLSTKTYKIVALLSLCILLYVQYRLIFNTYELRNSQYELKERQIINEAYSESIRNDKVFPGGQKVIDSFIYKNMNLLENLYNVSKTAFEIEKDKICDSLFSKLRLSSTMDSVFNYITRSNNLESNLEYALLLEGLNITFDGTTYIPLYNARYANSGIDSSIQTENGILIDGNLTNVYRQNRVTYLSVSTPSHHSYQIAFSLHVDKDNRTSTILKSMFPTLLLSLSSIFCVICIYYFTYRNWLKQKKLVDMKSDFLNSITHEFNTPISTILVANKSLQNREISNNVANIDSLTEVIKRQAQRLQTLINQALDISKMNKETMETELHSLNPLLEQIISDYKIKVPRDVYIQFSPFKAPCQITLNKFLFTTMLYNIFDNAIKYNVSQHKNILVQTILIEGNAVIEVRDNGIGMSEELIKFIFDKFYRGKNKLRTPGLGLGLYYVKQALEAHNWKLLLESELSKGSKFCIFIPM